MTFEDFKDAVMDIGFHIDMDHPDALRPLWEEMNSSWQPIETCPKETEVLVWFGPQVGVKSAEYTDLYGDDIWFWCVNDCKFDPHPVRRFCSPYPTHWMPLPEPPK